MVCWRLQFLGSPTPLKTKSGKGERTKKAKQQQIRTGKATAKSNSTIMRDCQTRSSTVEKGQSNCVKGRKKLVISEDLGVLSMDRKSGRIGGGYNQK